MSSLAEVLRSCRSPVDLIALTGAEPSEVTSPAISSALDAVYAHPARSKGAARAWKSLSRSPWPTRRARRTVACIGRRGLKSSGLLAWCVLFESLCVGHDAHAAEGSRLWFPVVAPRSYQAAESLHSIKMALERLAVLGVTYELRDENAQPVITIANPIGRCEINLAVFVASEVSVRSFAIPFWCADEASFFQPEGPSSLAAVARAMDPGGLTFPGSGSLWVSSPGVPEGAFFEAVEKPSKVGTLLIRAASWVANHRITEGACKVLAEGDDVVFEQEYAARRFGYSNEGFISIDDLACGDAYTDRGPREGFFVVALDAAGGEGGDAIGIGCCSVFDEEVNPAHVPIRHVVVEHSESLTSSKKSTVSIEAAVGRAVDVSRMYGVAPIVFDQWSAAEIKRLLREKHGYREAKPDRVPSSGQFLQAPMNPAAQTSRFRALRALVNGARLHLGARHENLRSQIGRLKAWMIASGDLRVEAKRDDEVDCLALCIEIVLQLPPTIAPGQPEIVCVDDGFRFDRNQGGVRYEPTQWAKIWPNGHVEPCYPPEWSPEFPDFAADMIAQGKRTPAIERWEARQQSMKPPAVRDDGGIANVRVQH